MREFFIEIFSEEIPARMQLEASTNLETMILKGLNENGVTYGEAKSLVTPRRIVLAVNNLHEKQEDVSEERRGPRADAPQAAVEGFCKANGIETKDLEVRNTPKGDFFYAVIEKKGRLTAEILKEVITGVLANFPWPKSMRWGEGKTRWVRPLHGIVCLFGGDVIDFEFAGVKTGNQSMGHRFLAPEPFEVKSFADYQDKLAKRFVILDREERKSIILKRVKELAAEKGLVFDEDLKLLEEVAGLVEYPNVLMGSIDNKFMRVPKEVLISSMGKHQKYFSLNNKDGSLAPYFVVVSNMVTEDNGKAIVAGNERVLRARLSDADFFFEQDKKVKLESRVAKLSARVFHANLGTDKERVDRIVSLAEEIAKHIKGADCSLVKRAALLCKADLTTGMVGEFPELQGRMGQYYAENDGEAREVAEAIAEHYSPLGPSDSCPKSSVSVAVALADKIDMLNGFWLADMKPTGSKDPFALRRACLGVIRLVLENQLKLSLAEIFAFSQKLYIDRSCGIIPDILNEKGQDYVLNQRNDLIVFFADRLKVYLKEKGVSHDLISAVFSSQKGIEDDLMRLIARVKALDNFLKTDDGLNLLTAFRRAANIVRIEEKKDKTNYEAMPEKTLFVQEEEKNLFDSLLKVMDESEKKLDKELFEDAMVILADLRKPVDNFFERVTVNCDDKNHRSNRLKLLSYIGNVMGKVADFSKIETSEGR
ncbi:MAG: glycine--tRNA ligase subunit beta [Alphaproteobacteria bacterium]